MSHFCYNRGCQKNYTPVEDPTKDETACQFHPGLPYFHDAYKIWSCCQKKSIDFTTFLSMPGCQRGPHQPTKPVEPVVPAPIEEPQPAPPKPVVRPTIAESQRAAAAERPSPDAPLVKMHLTVAASLQTALEKLANTPDANASQSEQSNNDIQPGTPCRHTACGARYTTADEAQSSRCRYHPGVAIFHEGMKYWSCCQKKTTDFDAFTAQPGCTEGEHLWRSEAKPAADENDPQTLKTACRYDFHQQGSSVVLSIYAKMPRPEQTTVELNAGRLKVDTYFGPNTRTKRFSNDWILFGLVDVSQSKIELLQSKIEIVLRKAEPLSWSRLDQPMT